MKKLLWLGSGIAAMGYSLRAVVILWQQNTCGHPTTDWLVRIVCGQ